MVGAKGLGTEAGAGAGDARSRRRLVVGMEGEEGGSLAAAAGLRLLGNLVALLCYCCGDG